MVNLKKPTKKTASVSLVKKYNLKKTGVIVGTDPKAATLYQKSIPL